MGAYGDAGNDRLTGGSGDDRLEGGLGSDQYVFKSGWGADTISNYESDYNYETREYVQRADKIAFGPGLRASESPASG